MSTAADGLRGRPAWWTWAPAILVCLVAAGLRFYRIDAQSLWYDEGISAFQLTRSYVEIARAAAGDTHPPLYYWLLKAWGSLFGETELGLRSLSATLGVLSVLLTWLLGRRLFGALAATVAATLLALSPLAVYYAQEVRMYTLVVALGLTAAYAYHRRLYWLYVPAAAATLYSQYLGAALLAAVHLHALLNWRVLGRAGWVRWIGANALVALLFLPWLPVFLDQSSHRALNTSPRTAGGVLVVSLAAYGGGLVQGDQALASGAALVGLAVLGFAARRRGWADASLALLLWLVPWGVVLGLGLRSGLFELRYLLLSMPGLVLLAGAGVAWLAGWLRPVNRALPAAAAAVLTVGLLLPASQALARQYFDPALARDDYRGAAEQILREGRDGDAVILSAPNQVEVFSFYYHGPLPVYPLPAQRPVDPADLDRRLAEIQQRHQRLWLVSWAMGEADPDGLLERWLVQNGFQASHEWFGTVQLSLIALARPQETESVRISLDNGIDLLGYRLNARQARPGDLVALTLVWQAREVPAERWKVFTHLLDDRSKVVAQRDAEPGGASKPTTTWQVGEVVEDNYGIALPADILPGTYTLEVGMYQESGRRAQFAGQGDHLLLGTVEVRP